MSMHLRPIRKRIRVVQNEFQTTFMDVPSVTSYEQPSYYEIMSSDDDPYKANAWKEVVHERFETEYSRPCSYQVYETLEDWELNPGDWKSRGKIWLLDPVDIFKKDLHALANNFMAENPPDWDTVARTVVPSLRNEFNTLNFLAELDDLPKLGRSFVDKARFLRPRGLRNRLKRAANFESARSGIIDNFLEYQLGIVPLLSDIETLNDNLLDLLFKERKKAMKISRAFEKLEKGLTGSALRGKNDGSGVSLFRNYNLEGPYSYGGGYIQLTGQVFITVRDHVHVKGSFGGPNPVAQLLDMAGIYPDLHTLWNAVPFSFLVDYVLPVGDTLEATYGDWSWQTVGLPGAGLSLVWAMTSLKIEFNWSCRWTNSGRGPGSFTMDKPEVSNGFSDDYYIGTPGKISGKYSYYTRFFAPLAVLDGIDLKPDQLKGFTSPSARQAHITAGIFHNAMLDGGRKTSRRMSSHSPQGRTRRG